MKALRTICRTIALLVLVLAIGTFCADAKEKAITKKELPKTAQNVINKYFPAEKIVRITSDADLGGKVKYEVDFASGGDIEFYQDGDWKSIECKGSVVPSGLIPNNISTYVDNTYPGKAVISIDKESHGYDVELNNGFNLKFEKDGRFLSVDRD